MYRDSCDDVRRNNAGVDGNESSIVNPAFVYKETVGKNPIQGMFCNIGRDGYFLNIELGKGALQCLGYTSYAMFLYDVYKELFRFHWIDTWSRTIVITQTM